MFEIIPGFCDHRSLYNGYQNLLKMFTTFLFHSSVDTTVLITPFSYLGGTVVWFPMLWLKMAPILSLST